MIARAVISTIRAAALAVVAQQTVRTTEQLIAKAGRVAKVVKEEWRRDDR